MSPGERKVWADQEFILAYIAKTGTVGNREDRGGGVTRQCVWTWDRDDRLNWRARRFLAHQAFGDSLERRMLARIDEPQGNRGSDVLLMYMGNGHRPELFRREQTPASDTAGQVMAQLRAAARERKAQVTLERTTERTTERVTLEQDG